MRLPELGKPFVGRRRELDGLVDLLSRRDARLITLTGFGGFGKTTLAVQAGRRAAPDFEHGAAFVALDSVTDPRMVAAHVARAFGLGQESGDRAAEEDLLAHLAERELLLILDNFEHVADARPLVSRLRTGCPDVVVLVTSRRRLNLDGEFVRELEPMALPAAGPGVSADTALGSEAVQLFVERAQAVRADFALDDANAADVAAICRTLEGIPLAIELAAARMRAVTPRDLLRYLTPRLGMASAGPADNDLRHQALGAMIAWSYGLLDPTQQVLFQRLCVFTGGFSIEGALRVGVGTGADDTAAGQRLLDDLAELEANHLIRFARQADGASRYEMLETIVEFGLGLLTASGERDAVRRDHAAYGAALALRAEAGIRAGDAPAWVPMLEAEQANLRGAIAWYLEHGEADAALRLCSALWWFWRLRGSWLEAIHWLEAAIAAGDGAPTKPLAIAWLYLGNSIFDDQHRAQRCYETSLRLFEQLGDAGGIAVAIGSLAMLADVMGEYDRGKELVLQSLAALRALPQDVRSSIAMALIVMADLEINSGHPGNARGHVDEALTLWGELEDEQHVAVALWRRGRVERLVGHPEEAVAFVERALAALRRTGDRNLEYMALADLGLAHLAAKRYEVAMGHFAASLAIAGELQVRDGTVAAALEGLARLRIRLGRAREATQLFAAADVLRQRSATPTPLIEQQQLKRELTAARKALGLSGFDSHWTIGRALTLDEATALALEPIVLEERPAARGAGAPNPAAAPVPALTPRELEVLCELTLGKSDREIGEALGIKPSTARTLVQRVRESLGVATRQGAALMAIEAGWCREA